MVREAHFRKFGWAHETEVGKTNIRGLHRILSMLSPPEVSSLLGYGESSLQRGLRYSDVLLYVFKQYIASHFCP